MHRDSKRLCDLRPGEIATVLTVGCQASSRGRLLELGLLPGTTVTFVRRAPFGDPLVVNLRGYALSLGRADAQHVLVHPADIGDHDRDHP